MKNNSVLILLALAFAVAVEIPTSQAASWHFTTIDSNTSISSCGPAMVADSSNNLHAVYADGNGGLKYVKRDATTTAWSAPETITTDSTLRNGFSAFGCSTSIAIDSGNVLHISYNDTSNNDVFYAYGSAGSWTVEAVDRFATNVFSTRILQDSSGTLHIFYSASSNSYQITHAYGTGSNWSSESIDVTGSLSEVIDATLDSSGTFHIAYPDPSTNYLRYAHGTTGSWSKENVVSCSACTLTGMAIESGGTLHIFYVDSNGYLSQSYGTAGSWNSEVIDNSVGSVLYGTNNNADITLSDDLHVFYGSASGAYYAHGTTGSWTKETVSSSSLTSNSDTVLDSNDKIHFIYEAAIHITLAVCGNSVTETDEECDDGNTSNGDSCSSVCEIEQPPVANAGSNRFVRMPAPNKIKVDLRGGFSSDPEGQTLTYLWEAVLVPGGSVITSASISQATYPRAFFYPDVYGAYTFRLTVTDIDNEMDTDEVTYTVGP